MKQRLGVIVGILAAFLLGSFAISGTATAADAGTSATKLEKRVKKAKKRAKVACKKVRKAKSKRARVKAKKRCKTARKKAQKLRKKLKKQRAKQKRYNAQFFDVCQRGCKFRSIQQAADAAGAWQLKTKRKATVRIQPGTYVEGVFLDGRNPAYDYNGLTIMGVKKDKTPNPDARAVILEGKDAKTIVDGQPQEAQNAIEGRSIVGLKMKNMWARNYQSNTFFVWAQTTAKPTPQNPNPTPSTERCADYVMGNLVSSDTRSYGLFARNCFGGKMINSEGWNHGDSAFYIGETPCDSEAWTNKGDNPGPCQANPKWTIIKNVKSHQNVLGYSGTNSKYVEISDSAFFNNGAGIVPNTLDSEKFEPNGWLVFKNNDIFWNNYNYYSTGSEFQTVSNGLGKVAGETVNYPIGIGIVLFGSDGVISEGNRIFGNEKWGAMSFSAPGDFGANDGDDGKNMNNVFKDNELGRGGADPNGVDFLNDATGGGNCWVNNGPNPTYQPGNGSMTLEQIYPSTCPTTPVLNKDVSSLNLTAGLQADLDNIMDPNTVLGYAAQSPPQNMECSWLGNTHPPYTDAKGHTYEMKRADPVVCP